MTCEQEVRGTPASYGWVTCLDCLDSGASSAVQASHDGKTLKISRAANCTSPELIRQYIVRPRWTPPCTARPRNGTIRRLPSQPAGWGTFMSASITEVFPPIVIEAYCGLATFLEDFALFVFATRFATQAVEQAWLLRCGRPCGHSNCRRGD